METSVLRGGPSPLSRSFSTFNFSIIVHPNEAESADDKEVTAQENKEEVDGMDSAVTTSFFKDRSGRTKLLAELCCKSSAEEGDDNVCLRDLLEVYRIAKRQVDEALLMQEATGVAAPRPDAAPAGDEEQEQDKLLYPEWKHSLLFECKCQLDNVIVEGINLVEATHPNSNEVRFYLDITARAIKAAPQEDASFLPKGIHPVKSTLDISAVLLSEKLKAKPSEAEEKLDEEDPDPFMSRIALGLLALELGGGTEPPPPLPYQVDADLPYSSDARAPTDSREAYHYGTHMTYSPSVPWNIRLVQPLVVTCSSIGGARAAVGATLVSLSMSHSNAHPYPVLVTNISLHPGNSSLYTWEDYEGKDASSAFGRSMPGGSTDVIDMTKHVRWTYAMGTAPTLPLKLLPYETFSTVLQIDAGEDLRSRTFVSPVAVTAVIDRGDERRPDSMLATNNVVADGEQGEAPPKPSENEAFSVLWDTRPSVIAADAIWTTERVATVPADALRIDMSLKKSRYKVGAPLVVALRVLNLSHEDRNLMLLMAKDEGNNNGYPGAYQRASKAKSHTVNTAVVSEVNGYTFGVWGLSGEDDGTTRQNRDHELLAVDAALLLGDVKGQHSVEAELRFVPLREGTLDVPNLKLYDKTHGKWYNCVHSLKIVAADTES